MSEGPEFNVDAAAADSHPLLAALHAQSKLWPFPSTDAGACADGFAPISALVDRSSFLESMLSRQQTSTPGLDRKGAAAFLMTQYGRLFGVTAAAPFVGFRLVPDYAPDRYALAFGSMPSGTDPSKRPDVRLRFLSRSFVTSDPVSAAHPDARELVDDDALEDRLRDQIERHFTTLIDRLHVMTHLSPAAAWRLVGDAVSGWFLEAGETFGRVGEAKEAALSILLKKNSRLSNKQVHFFDVTLHDDAAPEKILVRRTFRQRGGCCRLYTAAERRMCTTCVLRDPAERDAIILSAMRRALGLPSNTSTPGKAP
ncbi:ferric iron reductase [Terrihabitans sp. B22-R8]|uniref:ferric iron reductase n=1 Tax=Terrihabitans sp. B22-R8 TaxID=3425128 RepID=UPI00403CB7B3